MPITPTSKAKIQNYPTSSEPLPLEEVTLPKSSTGSYFPDQFYAKDMLHHAKIMDREPDSQFAGQFLIFAECNTVNMDHEHIMLLDWEDVQILIDEYNGKTQDIEVPLENIKESGRHRSVLLSNGQTITVHRPNAMEMAQIEKMGKETMKSPTFYTNTKVGFQLIATLTRGGLDFKEILLLPMSDVSLLMKAQMEVMPDGENKNRNRRK